MKSNIKRIATLGILCACSIILVALIHLPIIPAVSFLEYDPADIPILIGTFIFGPFWGLGLTVVTSIIQGITVSAQSGFYGIAMHTIATGTYTLVAGSIYKHKKTKKSALIAIICGTVSWVAVMIPANLLLTPAYLGLFGMDTETAKATVNTLLPYIVLFNLIKSGVNGIITYIVYKKIHIFLQKINLV